MDRYTWTIDPTAIEDLHQRLARTRWPDALPATITPAGTTANRGLPVVSAKTWARALEALDWRKLEDELNAIPQFSTEIDGEHLHFVHVESSRPDAVPLLLLHGWPGTVFELIDLIGPLTEPADEAAPAFHVVIPSHPGTGLSGPTRQPGWGVDRTARAEASLMAQLGYDAYFVQGGDHGAVLAPHVARIDPEHVRGVHVNAATIGFMPMGPIDAQTLGELSPVELRRMAAIGDFMSQGNGYNVIQATRPQTIGYGLEDSPVALLTWIADKVEAWTHDERVLASERYRSRQLANVLVYWLTRTATSTANNVYAEYGALFADPSSFHNSGVPTAVVAFAEDVSIRRFAEAGNTIVRWTDVDDGGHFAALEQPGALVADLQAFVAEIRATAAALR